VVDAIKDRVLRLSTQGVQPLLSTFRSGTKIKMEEIEDVTGPPESSDDEPEAPPLAARQDSDSDDGWQKPKDIKPTKFVRGKRSHSPEPGVHRSVRSRTAVSSSRRKPFIRVPKGPVHAKRPSGGTEGEHLIDQIGFTKQTKPNKSKHTFSRKNSQRSSQTSATKSPPPQGLLSRLLLQARYS